MEMIIKWFNLQDKKSLTNEIKAEIRNHLQLIARNGFKKNHNIIP